MNVLAVDDQRENLDFVSEVLARSGLRSILTVEDPRLVEALLPEFNPDLVLLDLRMPQMDGHEVLSRIVQFAGGTYLPVLVLTADASNRARNRALSEGARDFLTKPLDVTELTLRVANLLETRQLYQDLRREVGGGAASPAAGARAADVREILDKHAIRIAQQPVIHLRSSSVVGYEALARFPTQHARGTLGWFEDAEESGLGPALERMAAEEAVRGLPTLQEEVFLALNLSPQCILELPEQPLGDPAQHHRLVIELTEHVPVQDYRAVTRALSPMREAGARLAADDIGAGYAGFRHLVALEPDIIKLDISLVRGIHLSRSKRALARSLQAFASDMDATVIGEGIEEEAERHVLTDLGVEWGQGYHLGRPVLRELAVH